MNPRLLLLIFIATFLSLSVSAQLSPQALFVASKKGLLVRAEPNMAAKVVGALALNDTVWYRPTPQIDTIEMRVAPWIAYESDAGVQGYVFGGYLNSHPLPKHPPTSLREYISAYLLLFEESTTFTFLEDEPGEKFDRRTVVSTGPTYSYKSESQWEWGCDEYLFFDIGMHEILNLVEYCEFQGEKVEYQLLQAAYAQDQDLDLIRYNHAINDPPEDEITIQRMYPQGVRFVVKGGL